MANLKLVNIKCLESDPQEVLVWDEQSQECVVKRDGDYPDWESEMACSEGFDSGTKLIEMAGNTKLILEYENATWPKDKTKDYWELRAKGEFPYKKNANGELENVIPVEDIVDCSETLRGYAVDGHEIFSVKRGEMWDYNIQDFGITFNNDNFVLCVSNGIYNALKTQTTTYGYNGEILSRTRRTIDAQSLISQELKQASCQSCAQLDSQEKGM